MNWGITRQKIRTQLNAIQILRANFFLTKPPQSWRQKWDLVNGGLKIPAELKSGMWLWIEPAEGLPLNIDRGSYRITAMDDTGLYILEGLEESADTWTGRIWTQAIPPSVVDLARRICEWEIENPPTNIISEGVANFYNKQLVRSAVEQGGMPATAFEVFGHELRNIPKGFVTGVKY